MFKKLLDLGYQRNLKEAVGFYIAYCLFIGLGISGPLSVLIYTIFIGGPLEKGIEVGQKVGLVVWMIANLSLSFLILYKKRKMNHFGYLLLSLSSGALSSLMSVAGTIIPAFLTTRPPSSISRLTS